ncbi:hypothetical protein D3C87_592790 [compost metagenome]
MTEPLSFHPRLRVRTADFFPVDNAPAVRQLPDGPGVGLRWLTHCVLGSHLLMVAWLTGPRGAQGFGLAVADSDWTLLATHFQPVELPGKQPGEEPGAAPGAQSGDIERHGDIYAAQLRCLHRDGQGLRAMLAVEQRATRRYPGAHGGGVVLTSGVADWFRIEIALEADGRPRLNTRAVPAHHEPFCNSLHAAQFPDGGHWLALRDTLPETVSEADAYLNTHRRLHVAADRQGVPQAWRPIEGAEGALPMDTVLTGAMQARAYDETQVVTLLTMAGATRLCLLDLAEARLTQAVALRIPKGHWRVLAWRADAAGEGGEFWLHASNDKLSIRHRDSSLWRVTYGAAAGRGKKRSSPGLPVLAERITEDRLVAGAVAMDYADFTLLLWQHGQGIKNVEPMRCAVHPLAGPLQETTAWDCARLADSLPQAPAREVMAFGRTMQRPAEPSLPARGFDFAGQRVLVFDECSAPAGFPDSALLGTVEPAVRSASARA